MLCLKYDIILNKLESFAAFYLAGLGKKHESAKNYLDPPFLSMY
jgi:hypothetical protein